MGRTRSTAATSCASSSTRLRTRRSTSPAQTPFTASLTPREGDPRGAIELFGAARASGRRELEIHGRLFVDVSFGDFPYVLRFTPRAGG